jgi:Uma2 family endonuclease
MEAVMALPALKSNYKYTYGDYCSWPDEERWEIIKGVPFAMSPGPNRFHQRIAYALISQISAQTPKENKCEIYFAPFDVRLPEHDEADDFITTIVQPDISVICNKEKLDDQGCRGAPDLIMEILSPSTASRDLQIKKDLYEKHGVKEYWIVHPGDTIVIVYRQIESEQIYNELINGSMSEEEHERASVISEETYLFDKGTVYTEKDTVTLNAPEGVVIQLSEVFGE